jgi:hypothetical protein
MMAVGGASAEAATSGGNGTKVGAAGAEIRSAEGIRSGVDHTTGTGSKSALGVELRSGTTTGSMATPATAVNRQ